MIFNLMVSIFIMSISVFLIEDKAIAVGVAVILCELYRLFYVSSLIFALKNKLLIITEEGRVEKNENRKST